MIMKKYILKFSFLVLGLVCSTAQIFAQARPNVSQYFQNPYFVNPAYAGKVKGISLNMDYSFKPDNNQGSLKNQFFTADVNLKKSGLGLTLQNQENGLLSTKIAKITYAYHLKVTEKMDLHFGLSSGLTQERFDFENFSSNDVNDISDPLPAEFNNRKASFNVDFGTALTTDKFSLQMSVTNLRKVANSTSFNLADRVWYAAATYKFEMGNTWQLESVLAYSKSDFLKNRIDAGVRVNVLDEQVSLIGMYRSDKIFSTGLALKIAQGIFAQGAYNSSFTSYNLGNNGMFEFALRLNIKGAQ